MSQREVLRKQGELFALRHLINLSSDLLDTPDFYWERDDLESLYQQIYGYFNIAKRTKVRCRRQNIISIYLMIIWLFCLNQSNSCICAGDEWKVKSLCGARRNSFKSFKRSTSHSFRMDDHSSYNGRSCIWIITLCR